MEKSFDTLQSNKKITKMTKYKESLEIWVCVPKENYFSFQIFFWFHASIVTTNGKFSKI
jgi:hypothetical protein